MKIYAELIGNYKKYRIKSLYDNKMFSEINASMASCMFTIIRQSMAIIACHDQKKVGDTLKKVWHSMAFLDNETGGGMHKNKQLKNTDTEKQAGEYIQQNGNKIPSGWQSTVRGINADDPQKIRGDRADLLIYDEAGCHAPGTQVIMYDGTLKNVEDVVVGDVLMGDDGTPRNVIELHSGKQQMYKIIPNVGDVQIVNANHILYGKHRNYSKKTYEEFTMRTEDYYNMITKNPRNKDGYKLVHSNKIKFPYKEVPIDPYILGFWLGDGNSDKARFTTEDREIIEYLVEYGNNHNYDVRITDCENSSKCKHVYYASKTTQNEFHKKLRNLNILNNKHIPDCYLYNSEDVLLELLAGLIDSDGTYNKDTVEFTQSEERKHLVDQVEYICHLLGMKVSRDTRVSKERKINEHVINGGSVQYRLRILYGHSRIPCKLPRKQTIDRDDTKLKSQLDRLDTPFKIEKLDIGEYYGFSLDGNSLFLLKDFTVCHNSWPDLKKAVIQGEALVNIGGTRFGVKIIGGEEMSRLFR